MKINAYAKINIGLDVLGKREDGYHEVRMIMQTVGIHDELTVERFEGSGIRLTTNRSDIPVDDDNLICRAAKLFMGTLGISSGISVDLKKQIPVAAGLAGGSTDAAATLTALNDIFRTHLSQEELRSIGVKIGADVPYCIMGGTALSEGIGEILTPVDRCPDMRILLAKPPAGVSTAYVYKNLKLDEVTHPDIDALISAIRGSDIRQIASNMGNVLESVTVKTDPVISDIKKIMMRNGALGALMSGSGPTVFGVFESDEDIQRAYDEVSRSGLCSDIFITSTYDPSQQ